ncbi:MAG: winged helix-turn-helix domain-containing protein [Chlamydiota bacterium]
MPNIVRFDCYEVDLAVGRLCKGGIRVPLRDKSFALLAALLEHPGELVTREDLRHRLWGDDIFVDFDNNLNTILGRLRAALNDSGEHPRFVETLPRRGYRFIAEVHHVPPPPPEVAMRRPRLLVLPVVNLSGDPGEEYFSDAMTDEIITAIAAVSPQHLGVIARTTAMRYKGSRKDVEQIGHELAVDYVVEGSVSRANGRLTINVQLIQVRDQTHLFARKYDADTRDIFQARNCVAQAIATHIPSLDPTVRARMADMTEHLRTNPTDDIAAYNLYLQGRFRMYRDVANAKPYFEQALARDPRFALAYDGLAEYNFWAGFVGLVPPKEACTEGLWAALRALEIDNTLAETHALLGQFRKVLNYNWSEVQREMALARQLKPNSLLVKFRYAISALMPVGRLNEAVAELETVLDLDPLNLEARRWLGLMHWWRRDYDRAIEQAQLVLAVDPNYPTAHVLIGVTRCAQRKFDEGIRELRKCVELSNRAPVWLGWLGLGVAQSGDVAEARAILEQLHAAAEQNYIPASCFAWIHLGVGELDEAFAWMNRAVDERDPMMTPIRSYPFFDSIRADPRFGALLRKMNLEPTMDISGEDAGL